MIHVTVVFEDVRCTMLICDASQPMLATTMRESSYPDETVDPLQNLLIINMKDLFE